MLCGIGLGSNIEDRLAHIREGCRRVSGLHECGASLRVSSVYETSPVDCEPGTMPYLNAAMEINYTGQPFALIDRLLKIEQAMGRPSQRPKNAPRIIDLDILYMDHLVLNTVEIVIPHPKLHQRRFVLAPLAEISPNLILPGQDRSVRTLLTELDDPGEVTRLEVSLFNCG